MALATIKVLSPGWVTVPVVLPAGTARGPLRIGALPTQTDPKNVYPDGTVLLSTLTAFAQSAGDYDVTEGPSVLPPTPTQIIPGIKVWVSNQTESWAVVLRDLPDSGERWLSGDNVIEKRHVAPFRKDGLPTGLEFPGLRAYIDVRYYRDGGVRVSLRVENSTEGAVPQSYVLSVHLDGADLMPPVGLNHRPHSHYRYTFALGGLQEATVLPDWSTAIAAGAVPRYPTRATGPVAPRQPFPPFATGVLTRHMPATGGRPELGPVPEWAAELVGGKAAALPKTLDYAENPAGAWYIHVREADGSLPTIDRRPAFRFMPYVDPADPLFHPDHEHQWDAASVAYAATGDRYYLEELVFWANFCLLHTFLQTRGGSAGLMVGEETRGEAWGLDKVLKAAFLLPDSDPLKAYFADKARNNLAWWGNHQRVGPGYVAGGVRWHGWFPEHSRQCVRVWSYNYLAHVLAQAIKMGFGGLADDWFRAWLNFMLGWLSDPVNRFWAAAYTLPVDGGNPPGDYSWVWHDPLNWREALYWPDVMLTVSAGEEAGDPRAAAARQWIEQNTAPNPSFASRPHFQVLPRPTPEPPPPPEPEDPVYPVISVPFGVEAGLPDLRWDAANRRYRAGVGYRINALLARGDGVDPAVAAATFGLAGATQPDYSLGWPLRGAPFVPLRPGLHEARFTTRSGEQLPIPVMVEESDLATAFPLRTVASSYEHGTTSDDAVGWALDQYTTKRLYFNSVEFARIWAYRGTPNNMREEGPWVLPILNCPQPELAGIMNGGEVVMDPETGAMLMLCLRQLPGVGSGYGFAGLAVSPPRENPADRSWTWVGPVSGHAVTYEQYLAEPHAYGSYICGGGGGLYLVGNAFGDGRDYLFTHPSQVVGRCTSADLSSGDPSKYRQATCLRAELRPLVADALAGRDCRHHWQGLSPDGSWGSWDSERANVMPFGGYGQKVFYLRNSWWCLHQSLDGPWGWLSLSKAPGRLDGSWMPPQRLWHVDSLPNIWPSNETGRPMWGAPMVLDVNESDGSFLAGIVAYDGRDVEVGGGTGEVRVVTGRVTVR